MNSCVCYRVWVFWGQCQRQHQRKADLWAPGGHHLREDVREPWCRRPSRHRSQTGSTAHWAAGRSTPGLRLLKNNTRSLSNYTALHYHTQDNGKTIRDKGKENSNLAPCRIIVLSFVFYPGPRSVCKCIFIYFSSNNSRHYFWFCYTTVLDLERESHTLIFYDKTTISLAKHKSLRVSFFPPLCETFIRPSCAIYYLPVLIFLSFIFCTVSYLLSCSTYEQILEENLLYIYSKHVYRQCAVFNTGIVTYLKKIYIYI